MPLPAAKILWNDLLIAMSLLTRLPVPQADWSDETRPPARAAWAYPLVGLVVAMIAAALASLALAVGVPAPLAALIFMGSMVVSTGAMHEDGLADCADGFWGGWDKGRRLEIMKDSAIGTYGVLALVFVFACRWMVYTSLMSGYYWGGGAVLVWLAPAVMSRAAMVAVMQGLPHARSDGLAAKTGSPAEKAAMLAVVIGLAASLLAYGYAPLLLIALAVLAAIAVAWVARAKIAGQTGDVLGATQQLVELAILVGISATITLADPS